MSLTPRTKLNDKNLVKVINTKVIPVAAYPMNVCKFTQSELTELDHAIKRDLQKNNMLGRQASDERLYRKRDDWRRGLKSLREVYDDTRLRVGCYMFVSDNRWIKEAWKKETRKECNLIKDEIILAIKTKGKTVQFDGDEKVKHWTENSNRYWNKWKNASKKVARMKDSNSTEKGKCKVKYTINKIKLQQMSGTEFNTKKNIAILSVIEQMVETRA